MAKWVLAVGALLLLLKGAGTKAQQPDGQGEAAAQHERARGGIADIGGGIRRAGRDVAVTV